MAGRSPGHPRISVQTKDVDGRHTAGHDGSIGEKHSCFNPPIRANGSKLGGGALRFILGREERKAGRPAPRESCEMRAPASPERRKDLADDWCQAQCRKLKVVAARRGMVEEPLEAPPEVQSLWRLLGRGEQV